MTTGEFYSMLHDGSDGIIFLRISIVFASFFLDFECVFFAFMEVVTFNNFGNPKRRKVNPSVRARFNPRADRSPIAQKWYSTASQYSGL